jgi:hypothetical protein
MMTGQVVSNAAGSDFKKRTMRSWLSIRAVEQRDKQTSISENAWHAAFP